MALCKAWLISVGWWEEHRRMMTDWNYSEITCTLRIQMLEGEWWMGGHRKNKNAAPPRLIPAAPGRSGGVNHALAGGNVTVTHIFNGKWSWRGVCSPLGRAWKKANSLGRNEGNLFTSVGCLGAKGKAVTDASPPPGVGGAAGGGMDLPSCTAVADEHADGRVMAPFHFPALCFPALGDRSLHGMAGWLGGCRWGTATLLSPAAIPSCNKCQISKYLLGIIGK